jgi:glycerate dehydrogenase
MKVVFLERSSLPPTIDIRHPAGVDWQEFERTAPGEVTARAQDADVIIVNKLRLSAALLDTLPRLKMIAVAATGTDNVDKDYCRARGIIVSNVRDYATSTVPEHTFALILALRRNLIAYSEAVAQGRWQESGQFCFFDYPIRDLSGSVLTVVGSGNLGQAVGRLGEAFGMQVRFAERKGVDSPRPGYVSWETMLRESDVISLHCPLTTETRGMFDAAAFAQMARRPLLINTARGGLVDERALVDALKAGQIAGAGFDVTSLEPMPPDHPFAAIALRHDFILTPHVAWASAEAVQSLVDQMMTSIEAFIAGRDVLNVA